MKAEMEMERCASLTKSGRNSVPLEAGKAEARVWRIGPSRTGVGRSLAEAETWGSNSLLHFPVLFCDEIFEPSGAWNQLRSPERTVSRCQFEEGVNRERHRIHERFGMEWPRKDTKNGIIGIWTRGYLDSNALARARGRRLCLIHPNQGKSRL